MRKTLIAIAGLAGAALLATSAHFGAQAFWRTSDTVSFTVAPTAISLSSTSGSATLSGAGGTGYAWINIQNSGNAALNVSMTPAISHTLPNGVSTSFDWGLAPTSGATCDQTPSWNTFGTPTSALMASGSTIRLCARIVWSGATTASNGSTATFSIAATGSSGNWSTGTSRTAVSTFTGGPPPYPMMSCVVTNYDFGFLNLRYAGLPAGNYVLRPGSPSAAPLNGYNATAAEVADPGWILSPANVASGVVTTFYLTEENSTTPIAMTFADRTGGSTMHCGDGQ